MRKHEYTDESGNKVELSALVVVKQLFIEGGIPSLLTDENDLYMQLNQNLPFMNYEMFKTIRGKQLLPANVLEKEKYYVAAQNGELEKLWNKD